jgi:hypothetical protein
MIYYRPTDGDVLGAPVRSRPRTCFLMTQLGGEIPTIVIEVRQRIEDILNPRGFALIDATSEVTGRDFLLKIWEIIIGVPFGIAIIHRDLPPPTLANIYYELGLMQAYGKETLVIRVNDVQIPSDFVRTEYLPYDHKFLKGFTTFLDSLDQRTEYYLLMAQQLERNPLLAIDYLRRAYLLTADPSLRGRAQGIHAGAGLRDRAKNSLETLLAQF